MSKRIDHVMESLMGVSLYFIILEMVKWVMRLMGYPV